MITDFISIHSFYIGGNAPDNIPAFLAGTIEFCSPRGRVLLGISFSVREIFVETESAKALNDVLEWLYAERSASSYCTTSLGIVLCLVKGFDLFYPKRVVIDLSLDMLSKMLVPTWRPLRPTDSCQSVSMSGFQERVPDLLPHLRARVHQFQW